VIDGAGTSTKAAVLYNGVDPQMFSPPDSGPEAPTILSVGNLIPVKGHELLLRAFSSMRNQFPKLSLEIIGDGPERPRLQQLANEQGIAGKVNFRGRQSRRQVADAMRRATIFALPSRYEGLGCVYLEAMSAGRPAIGCLGQGIDEVIEPGVNGCLIKPDDLQQLTDTLTSLLQQPKARQKMGAAARRSILQSYTLGEQAARLYRLYQECRR
jgi:glycosyltransferase involved in cell wall biosynthesis